MELTLEQKRALALASARVRAGEGGAEQPSAQRKLANEYAGQDVGQMDGFLGGVKRVAGGAKAAFDRAAYGLGTMFPDVPLSDDTRNAINQNVLVRALGVTIPSNKQMIDRSKGAKAFVEEGGIPAMLGGVGFDVAATAIPAAGAVQATNLATKSAPLLAQALARGGTELGFGAGYGALTNPEDRGEGAKTGATGAAIGMGINRAVGGLLRPGVTPDAQALIDKGIMPTPGQALGGVSNAFEQKATSVPIAGDLIRRGRNRAVNEFNEKAIQTAVPSSKGFGDEVLTTARQTIGQQYDDALANLPKMTINQSPIIQAAVSAVDDPALALSDASKRRVLDYVEKNLLQRGPDIDGEVAKRVESDMAKAAQRFKASTDGEQKAMGEALDAVLGQWRQSLTDAANLSGKGTQLREADAAWRAFIPLDKAASSAGSQASQEAAGRFTPRALRRAIEASDKSQFNNATRAMRNDQTPFGQLNTMTRQAENVLGDFVPDSGTAGRLMAGAAAGGASAFANVLPEVIAGSVATGAAYSRPGTQFLLQGLEPAYRQLVLRGVPPKIIDETLRKYGPQGVMALSRGAALQAD